MLIKYAVLTALGTGAGFMVSAGVFALISSIGLIPRMAGKSHTGSHIKSYETAVLLGGVAGNVINIFELSVPLGRPLITMFGIFSGVFVGCLATSLAESLNATAVFSRRAKLHKGLGIIILSVALGKMLFSILFFYKGWYR